MPARIKHRARRCPSGARPETGHPRQASDWTSASNPTLTQNLDIFLLWNLTRVGPAMVEETAVEPAPVRQIARDWRQSLDFPIAQPGTTEVCLHALSSAIITRRKLPPRYQVKPSSTETNATAASPSGELHGRDKSDPTIMPQE